MRSPQRWTHLPGLFWWLFAQRVILRFIFCLETILGTIFNLATIFWINSLQNSLQLKNKPQNNPQKSHQNSPGRCVHLEKFFVTKWRSSDRAGARGVKQGDTGPTFTWQRCLGAESRFQSCRSWFGTALHHPSCACSVTPATVSWLWQSPNAWISSIECNSFT